MKAADHTLKMVFSSFRYHVIPKLVCFGIAVYLISFSANAQLTTQTYTSSGTFTVPPGVTSILVECWGAGGGGGSSNSNNGGARAGGGGGGGGYSSASVTVIAGNTYNIVVGTGGAGGINSAGAAGGQSTFNGTSVVAQGGNGGGRGGNGSGGSGAAAGTGSIVYSGGNGATGVNNSGSGGGGGGAGSTANGGNAAGRTGGAGAIIDGGNGGNGITGATQPGNTGDNYGGGGSGGYALARAPQQNGGSGSNGLVRVTYSLAKTYYSYKSGNWDDFTTWTFDPSGTLQICNTVPAANDIVVVLPGRTVTLTSAVSDPGLDLTIENGGFINMGNFSFSSGLSALRGQGTLQLSSAAFPGAGINTFVDSGGGTVEYNSPVNLPVSQATYNNLKINSPGMITLVSNLTLNGNLDVVQGTFRINDNSQARRQLEIKGNVTVAQGTSWIVGTGATNTTTNPNNIATTLAAPFINYYDSHSHRIVISGDFTNDGTVRFTNLAYPVYNQFPPTSSGPASGFATVYFRGTSNNVLICNGTTDFYNLVLDKGTDQTYSLTVSASAYENFRLFGANIAGGDVTAPSTSANPNLKKALWLRNGTMTLEGSIVIPSLSEGNNPGAPVLNFVIPANAGLKLNGIDVIVQSTADLYQEVNAAYDVSGGTGTVNGVISNPLESGILVSGKLEVANGFLSTKESCGILYSSSNNGEIILGGGTIDAKQFRSLSPGTGRIGYTQTGGMFYVRGRFQRIPVSYNTPGDLASAPVSTDRLNDACLLATAGSFSIENTTNVFSISGGTITIHDVPSSGSSPAYDILTSSENFNVSGGTLSLNPLAGTGGSADASGWLVSSNAPVGNLSVNRTGSSAVIQLNTGYPLSVLDNLTLQSGVLNANNLDIRVGGDFIISSGTTYTAGSNTTIFNGSGQQSLIVNTASAFQLNNLTVDKPAGTGFVLAGTQNDIYVSGSLSIYNATLTDGGKNLNVAGDIYNSGIHTGTGRLILNGTGTQAINGNGTGTFSNIVLGNTNAAAAPVSLQNNIVISGILTFSNDKLFGINTYYLRLTSTASIEGFGPARYVQTSGALGDGGLSKEFSSPDPFVFPVGVNNYTPATFGFNSTPATYGTITVIPVDYAHPNVTTTGRSLSYFWRIKSAGFDLGSSTVTHTYSYNQANVVTGSGITEAGYVPARYDPSTYTWTSGTIADVDETTNLIGGSFLQDVSFIDGDYTAGDNTPTNPFGTPLKFYSRRTGLWGTPTTWSLTGHTVNNPPAAPPGPGDVVIIGTGHTITFATPANYQRNPNTDAHSCASLQIETGGVLDIRFNPASTFSMVRSHPSGNGTIRIAADYDNQSTFMFPGGDFSDFNQNLGTTELYSTNATSGTTYWLPNGIRSYGNLIISPLGGSNIIFPNNDLDIFGNLVMQGQNADSWFCPTWNGNYPTAPVARVSKTITVRGDFDIRGGSLIWYGNNGGGAQDIVVNGDIIVAPGAGIDVNVPNTSQSLSIGGSLINNSTNQKASGTTTLSYVNLSRVPVTFFGNNDAFITSNAGNPRTDLGLVTVNKGNSQATTLTIDVANILNTQTNNWLTLQNGTLRFMRNNPGTNFAISTTTPFVIPATAGLYIDYTNSSNVNVLIGNATNNNGDLILGGKLTVVNGLVYVGPANSPASNNDIEYTGSGASEIDVKGGSLTVNGQIRRSGTSNGILKYSQSGGSVRINGQAAQATNAKLEILNSGSSFNMSGTGVLTIVRGGGTTYGDLYLRPESSVVTGGTIVIQPVTITAAEEIFKIDANVSLNNLTITGAGGSDAARAMLNVNPLVLNGNLELSNGNSFLTTNNLNVTIGGNFSNSGSYEFGLNTTFFNGSVQQVSGSSVTNFNNLEISPVTSVTVNNDFSVAGNLNIARGTLILSNRKLSLSGNLLNNGTYTDDNVNGRLILAGSTLQQIEGNGSFGTLELANASGARLSSDILLQNNLILTSGRLDISNNLLSLGLNSGILGGPFSSTNMIVTDGVISSKGIRKFFGIISSPTTFTFPAGVPGKYTPALLTINANGGVGYINVNPVNNNHPAVYDPLNALKYYWIVESSGITNLNGGFAFIYGSDDIRGLESDYVAARLLTPGNLWSKATSGPATDNVNESTNTISFSFPAGTNNLNGDYTAGADAVIPNEVPEYVSVRNGNWSDPGTWAPVGSSPPCPPGGPNGFVVNINHDVVTNIGYCFAYKTVINNRLIIGASTYGHNLGLVEGEGTLSMQNGNLPAGNYNSFFDCTIGGILEYGGSGSYTVIASQFSSIRNLYFTGSGSRILPNKDLTVCSRLVIDGPVLDNSINNRALFINGTFERYNTGEFRSGSGNAKVSFQGSAIQSFGGNTGTFTGVNKLNDFEINNPNGLVIGTGSIEVAGNLLLTNGIITTSETSSLIILNTLSDCVIPAGGSSNSFVNGPLTKAIPSGRTFNFPLGAGTVRGQKFIIEAGPGATAQWTVSYNSPNATATSYSAPLQAVNTDEYWSVKADMSKKAYIRAGWDANSAITPLMTENGLSDIRLAEYDGSAWVELQSSATGTNDAGIVETVNTLNFGSTGKNYTIGSISPVVPRISLKPSGPVCGTAGIPIEVKAFFPVPFTYTLTYSIDGVIQAPLTINSLPYTLMTPVPGAYRLVSFKYANGSKNGVVDGRIVNVYAVPGTADAGTDQSLCSVSGTLLNGNDPAPYTGLWTIVSGSGGTLVNSTLYNTAFAGQLGETYVLRWTISNVACSSFDEVNISFPVAAARPAPFTSAPTQVCQGSSGNIYTVPNVIGYTYNWNYSGTGHTISGTGNSVSISFNSTATSGTLSVTATNACGTSAPRSTLITVNIPPSGNFSYPGNPYCPTASDPVPHLETGAISGIFSAPPGIVFISAATGQIDLSASVPGIYTIINTIAPSGGCGEVVATANLEIIRDYVWTGSSGTDWNSASNWSCGIVPGSGNSIYIPDVPNRPRLSSGPAGLINDLTIEAGTSVTIEGNTLTIRGTILNDGSVLASSGTVVLSGASQQDITGSGSININNLTVNNAAGVTLNAPVTLNGILYLQNGNLASSGNLTLASTASGTALIDGTSAGTVTGTVTMQRYLSSAYGYKYFSSPFQSANVGEFSDEVDLTSSFPLFYAYDENRWYDIYPLQPFYAYTNPASVLSPMAGYALNFGTAGTPLTADVSGVLNNGFYSRDLYNHNHPIAVGRILVGNPYPSPINWSAAQGWTKSNIDNALYYFRASGTDQWGGTYSSWINGLASDGVASNIIPSMQGFLVHVSDGAYPVAATLAMDNRVRVNNMSQPFMAKGEADEKSLARLTVSFADQAEADHFVIYTDLKSTASFDSQLDALKYYNTDFSVPNLYAFKGTSLLSIKSLPEEEKHAVVLLGVRAERDGEIIFRLKDITGSFAFLPLYLKDAATGAITDLKKGEYSVFLEAGEYNNRFSIEFEDMTTGTDPEVEAATFRAYSSQGKIIADIYCGTSTGTVKISNLTGQVVLTEKIYSEGRYEFSPGVKTGIYIITYVSGNRRISQRLFIKTE